MSYRSLWLAVFGASLFVNACIAPTPSTLTTGGPTVAAVNPIVPTTNLTDGCITTYDPAVDYFPEKATLTHSDGFSLEYFKHYKVITVRTPAPGAEPLQFVLVQCGAPTPPGFAETQISQVPVKSIVAMSSTFVTTLDELNLLDRLVGLDEATYISNAKVLQMADAGQLTMIGVGAGVEELLAGDARYADFVAFQTGNLWNNNARLGPNGGNEYWEVGVVHPEVVLADLIIIFHPELLPEHELVYYLAG